MSRSGVPFLEPISASFDHEHELNLAVPELMVVPPTPRLRSSEAIEIPWEATRRHLSVPTIIMHESNSAPSASYLMEGFNPLTRDKRSQSVPLSLDAVALSKKLVNLSDKFEARHQAVGMRVKERSRTLSGSETPTRISSSLPKRHSDLIDQWLRESDELSPKIGSPV